MLVGDAEISCSTQISRVEKLVAQYCQIMSVELVWRSAVDHATTVWDLSRVKQGGAIRADDMDHKTATSSQVQDEVHVIQRELKNSEEHGVTVAYILNKLCVVVASEH